MTSRLSSCRGVLGVLLCAVLNCARAGDSTGSDICQGPFSTGGTDSQSKESKTHLVLNDSNPEACCHACAAVPQCSAWTVDDTTCRVKVGQWKLNPKEGSGNTTSGFRTPTPGPPPTPEPTFHQPNPVPTPPGIKNVLLILVDDLRPELGCYGHNTTVTPNVDKLASTGLLFQRAYVQFSFCAPSRNSFMTGRRPDRTTCFNFVNHFRDPQIGPLWSSMPEYFKKHGVLTLGAGKTFHPMLPPYFDVPYSWSFGDPGSDPLNLSLPYVSPGTTTPGSPPPGYIDTGALSGCSNKSGEAVAGDMVHWCSYNMTRLKEVYPDYGEYPLFDQQIVQATVQHLHAVAATKKPFFIACGLHRPHLPFAVPSEFHDILPPTEEIKPPKYNRPPEGSPYAAWHPGGFGTPPCSYNVSVPQEQTKAYRKAYYAAVSFMDSNVGVVLDTLDALDLTASTLTVFMGDHGWQLGEMDEWRKMTNWELGVRVPLIIRCPWKPQSQGVKTPALVEAVDIYQTIATLVGFPDPTVGGDGFPVQNLQGNSLAPYFDNPPKQGPGSIKTEAYSQFPKQNQKSGIPFGVCTKCALTDWDYFGYSVRNDNYRYTEWVLWNKTSLLPEWGQFGAYGVSGVKGPSRMLVRPPEYPLVVFGPELYDHTGDFGTDMDVASAKVNLAHEPQYRSIVVELSTKLHAHFNGDH